MLVSFRRETFAKVIALLLAIFFSRLVYAVEPLAKTLSPLEEKIGQAKILYYDFQFKKSEQLLNEVIESLKAMPSSSAVNHDLSEAYLRLALTQDAQNKPMQDSLYQSVSYEPSRELEQSQYAPSVIAQFNKAKQKFLLVQNQTSPNSKLAVKSSDLKQKNETQASSGQKSDKKKPFYKTWPFFLIIGLVVAGAGAGAAVALSGGGSGSGGGTAPATAGGIPQ